MEALQREYEKLLNALYAQRKRLAGKQNWITRCWNATYPN